MSTRCIYTDKFSGTSKARVFDVHVGSPFEPDNYYESKRERRVVYHRIQRPIRFSRPVVTLSLEKKKIYRRKISDISA